MTEFVYGWSAGSCGLSWRTIRDPRYLGPHSRRLFWRSKGLINSRAITKKVSSGIPCRSCNRLWIIPKSRILSLLLINYGIIMPLPSLMTRMSRIRFRRVGWLILEISIIKFLLVLIWLGLLLWATFSIISKSLYYWFPFCVFLLI